MKTSAEYAKARYQRLRAAGLCGKCGTPSEPGRSLCAGHLEAHRSWQREKMGYCKPQPEAPIVVVAPFIPKLRCSCGNAPMTGRDVCWCCDRKKAAG
jgi:hypothetical protein